MGEVEAEEQTWRVGAARLRPFCEQRGVAHRGCSLRLQRALVDFGADEAFGVAAAKVREHYGVEVARERVRRVCLEHAGRLAREPVEPRTRLRPEGPGWIVAEADGTMVPIVDTAAAPVGADRRRHRALAWQEAKVVAARAQGEATTCYDATLGEVPEAGLRWSRVVGMAGQGANTRVHAVGDGAPWIAQQAKDKLGPAVRYTLDLYHVCDYLAAVWPGDRLGLRRRRDALKAGGLEEVLGELRARLEPPELPEELAPARSALRYLQNRPDQLDYPAALRESLPVGSGLIESAHRHLLQSRLKKAGAWWTRDNAHAMAQLRVCRANNLWEDYWRN